MTTMVRAEDILAPVLAVSGGRDVIHPPATVRETAKRLGAQVQVMPEMSHWLIGEPGWRDVADLCLGWLADAKATLAAE
jgi:pimeloyl-ACP methyl ester carboxylesterase